MTDASVGTVVTALAGDAIIVSDETGAVGDLFMDEDPSEEWSCELDPGASSAMAPGKGPVDVASSGTSSSRGLGASEGDTRTK